MAAIQQKIGEGQLKTGTLTPEQAQIFLAKQEDIRRDYLVLREKNVYREEWESLLGRLDLLDAEVSTALARPPRVEMPPDGRTRSKGKGGRLKGKGRGQERDAETEGETRCVEEGYGEA